MERRQLEYFLSVVDNGSFTAAAAVLHVAQPSLSQAVRTLERELGAELLHRLPRGIALTAAGEALLAPARQVMRDLRTAQSAVQEVIGLTGGRLDLAMLPALALAPLAPVLGEFRRRFPRVQIAIAQPEESAMVSDLVRTGQAELGFLNHPGETVEELEVEALCSQALMAVLPPGTRLPKGRPLSWDYLLDRGLISGTRGTLVRDLVERWAAENGRSATLAIELGRRETALYLVLAGAGAAAFPSPLATLAESLGAVVRPLSHRLPRDIALCHRRGPLSPAAAMFLAVTRGQVGKT